MITLDVEFDSANVEIASEFTANVETWIPDDPKDVLIDLRITIGILGDRGTNDFQTMVFTLKALSSYKQKYGEDGLDELRKLHPIVVDTYDWPLIRNSIMSTIRNCERETWEECVDELRKHFHWEYEGITPTNDILNS